MTAVLVGLIGSLLYLANIGAGFLEIIPDNLPVVGNLDEVVATIILIACLKALGFSIPSLNIIQMSNKAVDSTATRVTPPANPSLRSGQESRHGQP